MMYLGWVGGLLGSGPPPLVAAQLQASSKPESYNGGIKEMHVAPEPQVADPWARPRARDPITFEPGGVRVPVVLFLVLGSERRASATFSTVDNPGQSMFTTHFSLASSS